MLERLKRRLELTGNEKDALLEDLLEAAMNLARGYTGRKTLPPELDGTILELASGAYNRLGMEGEKSHAEGGISMSLDALPWHLSVVLDSLRLARVGG